jgi:hypothetical protein
MASQATTEGHGTREKGEGRREKGKIAVDI